MIALVLATACGRSKQYAAYLAVESVPEAANEDPARNPVGTRLGGPYGHGAGAIDPHKETPEAPEKLTESIANQTLVDYLNRLTFDMARDNGELASVACHAPASKDPCSVPLYIEPEVGMRYRDHAKLPPNGIVVARIINYSESDSDVTYGVPPVTRAYWYVYPTFLGPRSRVFIRVRAPNSTQALKFIGPEEAFSRCKHADVKGPAVAKFRRCVPYSVAELGVDGVRDPGLSPFVRFVSLTASLPTVDVEPLAATELWVKCSLGCCVAGAS